MITRKRVLITGGGGQLATDLATAFPSMDTIVLKRGQLDVSRKADVHAAIQHQQHSVALALWCVCPFARCLRFSPLSGAQSTVHTTMNLPSQRGHARVACGVWRMKPQSRNRQGRQQQKTRGSDSGGTNTGDKAKKPKVLA